MSVTYICTLLLCNAVLVGGLLAIPQWYGSWSLKSTGRHVLFLKLACDIVPSDIRQGSKNYSDMGHSLFLNSTFDMGIYKRQGHAILAFLKIDMWHGDHPPPVKGPSGYLRHGNYCWIRIPPQTIYNQLETFMGVDNRMCRVLNHVYPVLFLSQIESTGVGTMPTEPLG